MLSQLLVIKPHVYMREVMISIKPPKPEYRSWLSDRHWHLPTQRLVIRKTIVWKYVKITTIFNTWEADFN